MNQDRKKPHREPGHYVAGSEGTQDIVEHDAEIPAGQDPADVQPDPGRPKDRDRDEVRARLEKRD